MDANELRAAAERVRALEDGCPETVYLDRLDESLRVKIARDLRTVARAYLAEHPADDGDPVTEEWLRAVGFYNDHPDSNLLLRNSVGVRLAAFMPNGYRLAGYFCSEPTRLPTRGHVRRLCAALGVPLAKTV